MAAAAKRIVVTGANKGIGLAIVKKIIETHSDAFVFLGSRSVERGKQAWKKELGSSDRVEVLEIDVGNEESVKKAAAQVRSKYPDEKAPLYGLVCNAGVAEGGVEFCCDVNTYGAERSCRAFLPLLKEAGRISITSSAAGPSFVSKCTKEMQQLLCSETTTWKQIQDLMQAVYAANDNAEGLAALCKERGMPGAGDNGFTESYGISKALVNTYMLGLAREHSKMTINACTPGFIATALTEGMAKRMGRDPSSWNMKTPEQGTLSTMKLIFDDVPSGEFWGSDGLRSPLFKYRDPGTAEYTGGNLPE